MSEESEWNVLVGQTDWPAVPNVGGTPRENASASEGTRASVQWEREREREDRGKDNGHIHCWSTQRNKEDVPEPLESARCLASVCVCVGVVGGIQIYQA